jgi:neurofibromin 1
VLCLAAFGSTVSRGTHDPRGLTYIIPSKFLPDQMCTLKDPNMLLNFLLAYLIDSLVSEDLFIREVAKEALGTELSPRLFSRVFKYLDE